MAGGVPAAPAPVFLRGDHDGVPTDRAALRGVLRAAVECGGDPVVRVRERADPAGRHPDQMLFGVDVSAGFVDRANARLSQRLEKAGFDPAMLAALLTEPVLGADESPVEVITPQVDLATGQPAAGPRT